GEHPDRPEEDHEHDRPSESGLTPAHTQRDRGREGREDGCCEGVRQATVEVEPQLAYVAASLADAPQASDEDVERQLRWTRERLLRRRLESERQGDGADT